MALKREGFSNCQPQEIFFFLKHSLYTPSLCLCITRDMFKGKADAGHHPGSPSVLEDARARSSPLNMFFPQSEDRPQTPPSPTYTPVLLGYMTTGHAVQLS